MNLENLDFEKGGGLLPAIVQDAGTHQVLMLGYMNEEAVTKTIEEKRVTFFSRSKGRLWTKGESSENYLNLVSIQADCDNDSLLIMAEPEGPTCHTGETSCFHEKPFQAKSSGLSFLNDLENLIRERRRTMPEESYTSYLFNEGIDKIAQKVGEEAVETVIEAKNEQNDKLIGEVADLFYHLLVLLVEKGISLEKIVNRLKKRHMKSSSHQTDE